MKNNNSNKRNAIGYGRISMTGQSLHSTSGQDSRLDVFANENDLNLIKVFFDEKSAKNFNRKGWKDLMLFVKKNHRKIDFLLVDTLDRFSRNVYESFTMLRDIQMKYGIKIVSAVDGSIDFDNNNPAEFQKMATDLINAHTERLKISDRVTRSTREAREKGTYTGASTPLGYRKIWLDETGKRRRYTFEIDKDGERIHRFIVSSLLENILSIREIQRRAQKLGFKKNGNDAIKRAVLHPMAYGLNKVIAYRDKPEYFIKSIYEAIHDESIYYVLKQRLEGNQPKNIYQVDETFYLRGLAHCGNCGRLLTGGWSKGKLKKYPFYRCNKNCKGSSHNANKGNVLFSNIINSLNVSEKYQALYLETLKEQFEKRVSEQGATLANLKREVFEIEKKIETFADKYAAGFIPDQIFYKSSVKWSNELRTKESEIKNLDSNISEKWELIENNIDKLGKVGEIFEAATAEQKQKIIKVVFPQVLVFKAWTFRTPTVNDFLIANTLNIKGLEVGKSKGIHSINEQIPTSTQPGTTDEHAHQLSFSIFQVLKDVS